MRFLARPRSPSGIFCVFLTKPCSSTIRLPERPAERHPDRPTVFNCRDVLTDLTAVFSRHTFEPLADGLPSRRCPVRRRRELFPGSDLMSHGTTNGTQIGPIWSALLGGASRYRRLIGPTSVVGARRGSRRQRGSRGEWKTPQRGLAVRLPSRGPTLPPRPSPGADD
jgi:hypothetical protein